jgi:hypothetical protein
MSRAMLRCVATFGSRNNSKARRSGLPGQPEDTNRTWSPFSTAYIRALISVGIGVPVGLERLAFAGRSRLNPRDGAAGPTKGDSTGMP